MRRVPRGRRAWGKLRPPNGRFPGTVGQSMTVQGSPAPAPAAPMGAHCLPAEGAVPRPALPRLGPAAAGPRVGQPPTPDPGSVGRPATLPGPASVGRENQRPRTQGAAAAPRRPRRGGCDVIPPARGSVKPKGRTKGQNQSLSHNLLTLQLG